MAQLGCNYSPELMELVREEIIQIDWIKLSNENNFENQFKSVNSVKPVLLHFAPRVLAKDYPVGWNLESMNRAIEQCCSPHVALHLLPNSEELEKLLDKESLAEEVIKMMHTRRCELIGELLIENMPINCLADEYKMLADPEFITEICEKTGVGLCLDMAHAMISAHYRSETVENYLERLPLELVREIHLSSPRENGEELIDVHQELMEEDYELFEYIYKKTKPSIVTLEYGGEGEAYSGKSDKSLLKAQLERISGIVDRR